ncbi:polyprenyl synthetase family protein [Akkermansiaceae bacterium]|nr:polyprenyl synthetase family protein [Akkermansiaceae bacterium]MDA8980631.1 polyprenyl synthetase family protein [bacterium]MDA7629212.1 polyprenyl synthetase family protein [Akkermansiaceae bacterium]MDA7863518.1 polyprenyl synthetase family protein [Akkermansiaceae bacterium]MDB0056227.1 polyprenyl synthetase family protein [Akkermansiaceae bacterium]
MATKTITTEKFPFELVAPHLEKVESQIREQVRDFDPGVEPYMAYICDTSGKRIRPTLAILTGGATGELSEDHINLGVILELIHMATLVHDDIIDGASTRRKVPTPNAKWGNGMAVLLGDALFSHALKLSTDFNDLALSRAISLASREVCQGEILQTQRRFDLTVTKAEYFRMIEMKTGALFAAASGLAAKLSGRDENICEAMHDYGMKLGTAYQIYDDVVDIIGTEAETGKTLGTDLEKGKLTLPILNLLEAASPKQKEKLTKRIIEQQPLDLNIIGGIAEYEGAVDRALKSAAKLVAEARATLSLLNDSESRTALEDITLYVDQLLKSCR